MNRQRINEWVSDLLENPTVKDSVHRWHVNKNTLYMIFKTDAIKEYPGVNAVTVEFDMTWHKRIKLVEHVKLIDMWEDKFGCYNITVIAEHVYGYGPLNVAELVLSYLKDAIYKRNEKFGI